jgi:hypothetical protein
MKYIIPFLLFLSSPILILNAQEVAGTYDLKVNATNADLARTLTLNTDGTFEFYSYERHDNGIPREKHFYGKGTWTQHKKVISFFTESTDLNDKFTLDFTGTKARFISKSPRDKSDRVIKTALSFYESEIFWVTGMTLTKP